jgi:hypothetical protein
MDATTRLLVRPTGRRGILGLRIALVELVVIPRRLVALAWMAGTLLAAVVLALAADLLRTEVGVTAMALAMHSLAHLLANQILSTPSARDSNSISNISLPLLVTRRSFRRDLLLALILRLLDGMTRALLASLVAAFEACLVGSIRSIALVASTMDAHTDILLHPLDTRSGRQRQVGGLEVEAVLLEQGLGTFRSAHGRRRGGRDLGRPVRLVLRLLAGLRGGRSSSSSSRRSSGSSSRRSRRSRRRSGSSRRRAARRR